MARHAHGAAEQLREFGIFIPVGAQHVVPRIRALLLEPTGVPLLVHTTLAARVAKFNSDEFWRGRRGSGYRLKDSR